MGVSFDIGVTESSLPADNPNYNAKGDKDLSKVYSAMHTMLNDLTARVKKSARIFSKFIKFLSW